MSKKRILLVDDEVIITQILTVILEDEFNAVVESCHSGREAIDLLKKDSAFDLIVSDYGMPHGTGEDLFKYAKGEMNLPIPFILFSGGAIEDYDFFINEVKDENQCYFVEKPSDVEIINVVKTSLEKQVTQDREQVIVSSGDTSYLPMPIEILIKYMADPSDVFLKINDAKYLKVSSKLNDSFIEDLERQKDKGVKELYLEKHEFLNFFHSLQVKLQGDDQQASTGKRILFEIAGLTINVDQQKMADLKVPKFHQELVNQTLEGLITDIKSSSNIFNILSGFTEKVNYLSDHSILVIYFSSLIAKKLGWFNEKMSTQLALAGFFHDITLKDEFLAKIETKEEIFNFDDTEQKLVLEHPEKCSQIVEKFNKHNQDAINIILNSQELPNGNGFPKGLNAQTIQPLPALFILSHKIVSLLFEDDFKVENLGAHIQNLEKEYDQGNFKRPYKALREILLD